MQDTTYTVTIGQRTWTGISFDEVKAMMENFQTFVEIGAAGANDMPTVTPDN